MAKKKTLRTNWKSECARAVDVRNYYSTKCEGLEKKLEAAEEEIKGQSKLVVHLEARASNVGDRLDHIQTIAEQMTSAPAYSISGEGGAGYGRDILLGMLLEKLRSIPRPPSF